MRSGQKTPRAIGTIDQGSDARRVCGRRGCSWAATTPVVMVLWLIASASSAASSATPAAASHVASVSSDPCGSPRSAAATLIANLRDDRLDVRKALRCVEADGSSMLERQQQLLTLKAALDAVGARVRLDDLSTDPNFTDPRSFEQTAVLSKELPSLKLEKLEGGLWMVSAATLSNADEIYRDSVTIDLARLRKRLPSWTQRSVFGVAPWQVAFLGLFIALGTLAHLCVVRLLLWRSAGLQKALKVSTTRDDVRRVLVPLGNLALAAVVALGAPSLSLSGEASIVLMMCLRIFALIAALTFLYRVIDVFADEWMRRAALTAMRMDDHIVPLTRRMMKIAVVVLGAVLVLQLFDVNVGSLVAGLGIGGLAVALAAKDTIGNFFGSVAIFLDRPFQIGDWVATPEVQGIIEQVGFRSTQIRTIRDTVTSVPNAKLADAVVDNLGARRFRLVRVTAGIQYDSAPEQIEALCDGVRAIVHAHPDTRKHDVEVHLNDFQDSALAIFIQFYVVAENYSTELRIRHEVLLDVVRLARDLRVSFAFPTRTIHLASESPAVPAPVELVDVIRSYSPGGSRVQAPGPRVLPRQDPQSTPATDSAGLSGGQR